MDSNSTTPSNVYRLTMEVLLLFIPFSIVALSQSQQLVLCLKFGFLPTLLSSLYIYLRRKEKKVWNNKQENTDCFYKDNFTLITGFLYSFFNHPECEGAYQPYSDNMPRACKMQKDFYRKNRASSAVKTFSFKNIGGSLSFKPDKVNRNTKLDSSQKASPLLKKNHENSKIRLGSPMLFGMFFIPFFIIILTHSETNMNTQFQEIWHVYPSLMVTSYCFSFLIRFSPIHIIDLLIGIFIHYAFSLILNKERFQEIFFIYFIGSSQILFTVLVLEIFSSKTRRALSFNEAAVLSQLIASFIFFTIWEHYQSYLHSSRSYQFQLGNYLSSFAIIQISILCIGSHLISRYLTFSSKLINTLVISNAVLSIIAAGSLEFDNSNLFLWMINLLIEDYENSCIIFTWTIISFIWIFCSSMLLTSKNDSDLVSFRKGFHFLIVFVLLIAIYFVKMKLLFSILHLVIWFFSFIEFFRIINDNTTTSEIIFHFYSKFLATDSRDSRYFIFSHLYLILGVSIPIFISEYQGRSGSAITPFLGIIVTGIGDSMGAIIGRKFGRTPLPVNKEKTIEGSASFLISCIISTVLIEALIGGLDLTWYKIIITYIMATIFESYTQDIDNLNLPLFTFITYQSLSFTG